MEIRKAGRKGQFPSLFLKFLISLFNTFSRIRETIWKSGKQEGNGHYLLFFPDVPDFLIQHVFQNTGDYLEIRKAGRERSISPLRLRASAGDVLLSPAAGAVRPPCGIWPGFKPDCVAAPLCGALAQPPWERGRPGRFCSRVACNATPTLHRA